MKKRKHFKRWVAGIFAVAALFVLAVNALLLWVMSGPRDIGFITPYIESALLPEGSKYEVDVENTILFWNSWKQPLGVKITQVRINTPDHITLAAFPEIYLKLSIPRLMVGIVQPTSLEVSNPRITFSQREDGTLTFGLSEKDDDSSPATLESILGILETESGSGFRKLIVHNAKLKLGSKRLGVFLESPNTDIEIRRVKDGFGGNIVMDILYEDKPSRIDLDFHVDTRNKLIQLDSVFSDIEPAMLARLLPDNEYVKQWSMVINGWSTSLIDYNGKIQSTELGIDAGPGVFSLPDQFEEPLNINRIQLGLILRDDFKSIEVKNTSVDFGDPVVSLNAKLYKDTAGWKAEGRATGEKLAIDTLSKYWPKTLAPLSRTWVTTNIRGGRVPSAFVDFNFAPGELDLPYTPDKSVKAEIKVENSSVLFLQGLPKVTAVNGVVKFTGKTMDAILTKGKFLNATNATAAHIHCPDLNAGDTRMTAAIELNAPATDVATFLAFPQLGRAKRLGITSAIKGSVSGSAKLDFIAFREGESASSNTKDAPINTKDFDYDISANLKNVTQAGFLGKRDIADATGMVTLNKGGVTYKGTAVVDGMALTLDAKSGLSKSDPSEYTAKGTSTASRMSAMGYDIFKHMQGDIGLDVFIRDAVGSSTTDAKIDLTAASVNWKEYDFSKAKGVKAVLDVKSISQDGKSTVLDPINVTGDAIKLRARATLNPDGKTLETLDAKQMQYGKNDVELNYQNKPVGFDLKIKGKSFDAEPHFESGDDTSSMSTTKLRLVTVDADVERLYLKPNRVLLNVVGKISCKEDCNSIDLKGEMPSGKPFTYRMLPEGGKRKLNVYASDAGEFFKTMGIFDTIQGGQLNIEGTFNDAEAGKPLIGLLTISEHSLKDAPVLTRILTIASLTGIMDGLSGKGITFTKLKAPFTYSRDVITLRDAKSHGSSIGLTASGTVNLKSMMLDLSGTVVPAYAVNTLLGKIPLIGEIAGGKDSGLIAINYSVKGKASDPDVTVNPLSALTPGFTRNIFNIFDKPAPKNLNEEALKKLEKEQDKKEEDDKQQPADEDKQSQAEKPQPQQESIRPKKKGSFVAEPAEKNTKIKPSIEIPDAKEEEKPIEPKVDKEPLDKKPETKPSAGGKKEIMRSPEATIIIKKETVKETKMDAPESEAKQATEPSKAFPSSVDVKKEENTEEKKEQ